MYDLSRAYMCAQAQHIPKYYIFSGMVLVLLTITEIVAMHAYVHMSYIMQGPIKYWLLFLLNNLFASIESH